MKKIYVSICALAISLSAVAQVSNQSLKVAKVKKSQANYELAIEKAALDFSPGVSSISAASAVTFWSEDFDTGIPSTWAASAAPWVYRGTTTTPNNTVGSVGAYSGMSNNPPTNDPIASTTASNGFIIFDSDFHDNGGSSSTMGGGLYPTPHNGELMTDMIDMSAYTDVTLKMHSYFRTFMGEAFVRFYINGVYDSQVQVHADLDVNEGVAEDYIALVRVPFTVVGNANVQMMFQFEGTTNSNSNGSGYYFWMLDDLELMETPPYLMEALDQNHGGWDIGYATTGASGMDYTIKPLVQSNANPYMFEMILANTGAEDLHGTKISVDVWNNGSSVFTSSSDTNTLALMDTAAYLASQTYAPTSTGLYEMSFWGSSDEVDYTDTTYMSALISDTVYGRDYGNPVDSWRVGRECGGLQLGVKYDVYAADEITSVSAHIADYSVVGTDIFAVLYEVDTTGTSTSYLLLEQSDDYTLQASDIDNWLSIPFLNSFNAAAGQQYMIAIGGYASPTDTFGISVSGDAEITTAHIQDNGCNLGSQSSGYWYWIGDMPMIRMNFGSGVSSIFDNSFDGAVSVYPNPSKGNFILELDGVTNDTYSIEVTNVLGQSVYSTEKHVNGFVKENIDLSAYGKGTYIVKITNSSTSISKKLIVE